MDIQAYEWLSWAVQFLWYIIIAEFFINSLLIISLWRIFEKGGISPWLSLIPLVNVFFLVKIAQKKYTYLFFILLLVPLINIIIWGSLAYKLSLKFDKSGFYSILLFLFPILFIPHLAFSGAKYSI